MSSGLRSLMKLVIYIFLSTSFDSRLDFFWSFGTLIFFCLQTLKEVLRHISRVAVWCLYWKLKLEKRIIFLSCYSECIKRLINVSIRLQYWFFIYIFNGFTLVFPFSNLVLSTWVTQLNHNWNQGWASRRFDMWYLLP